MKLRFATSALVAAIGIVPMAQAVDIDWNVDADGLWSETTNWNPAQVPGAGDDVLLGGVNTTTRTIDLDGDRTINSLEIQSDERYILEGGALTLTSGNLTIGETTYTPDPTPTGFDEHRLNVSIQIGDGVTAVNNAVWDIHANDNPSNTSFSSHHRIGEVIGIAGTNVELTGNGSVVFMESSNNYLGDWNFNHNEDDLRRKITINADNALGLGQVTFTANANLHFLPSSSTHAMDLAINAPDETSIYIGAFNTDPGVDTATLQGDLSGSGDIQLGRSDAPYISSSGFGGTLILEGTNNTHSGDIALRAGAGIQVDGVWTGAGNITTVADNSGGRLAGSGTLGMASGSVLTVTDDTGSLAPGTDGTIGTFTVGTAGNSNSVVVENNGTLLIDIDGNDADQLVILGDLDLSNANDVIAFSELSAPTAAAYTLITYTGSLTGEFDVVDALPTGYSLDYSTAGQVNLVPEPGSLALLGLGGLALLGRRSRK